MEFKIETRKLPAKKVIYMPVTLSHEEMRDTGRYFMKLGIHAFTYGIKATGVSFIIFTGETKDSVDLEICFEVEEFPEEGNKLEVDGLDDYVPKMAGEIQQKELEQVEKKYAVGYHKGSRKEMPKVYTEMGAWFKENGLERSGEPLVEVYLNNSHQVPEKELLTELMWPIK
ncbi:MAG: GyrI-like domain-containing protein [Defluviitaleaceae bacterium]|nr:GyrI-like domain-containing protein [Defluviitaleaceae bacterium]